MATNYRPECGEGSHGSPRFMREMYTFLGPNGLVLDCGAGVGFKTEYLKSKGVDVVSIDVDMSSCKKLYNNVRDTTSFIAVVCGDAQYLPFKSDVFDSVLCSEVLEHLPNPILCINEIYRTMKSNTTAVFTTPVFNLHFKYLIVLWRKFCGIEDDKSHLHVFSTKLLLQLLGGSYSIEDVVHRGYTECMVIKFGFDKSGRLDKKFVRLSKRCKLITRFSSKIWVKVKSNNKGDGYY